MADNFLSYFGDQIKQWFNGVRDTWKWLVRWITNKIAQKDWGENNTTLSNIITWAQTPSSPSSTPISAPTLDKVAEEDVKNWGVDVSGNINLTSNMNNWWGQASTAISTPDLVWNVNAVANSSSLDNLQVEDLARNAQREEEAENENWLQTGRRWLKGRYNSTLDAHLERSLESVKQSKEKHFALAYDPDSKDITELVINEPQWYFGDFWNTLFSKWESNAQIFNSLLQRFNEASQFISSSNKSEAEKILAQSQLFDALYKEVNDRELLRAFRNDHYSDWNLYHALYWDETKVFWRLKNKYTQEELNKLALNNVAEWVYKPSKEEFAAFLQMYEDNQQLADDMSLKSYYWEWWAPDKATINYHLTEESLSNLRASQAETVLQSVRNELLDAEDRGLISSVKRNEIESYFITTINKNLANAYYWMETPLAYYTAVKNKDYWSLTDWERAILWYWPWMEKLMNDYTNALWRWATDSIRYWIVDWELVHPADSIDGKSINEFFVDSIRESNIQAWWMDLFATESAIDAMQQINNNIWYLYWQGKWNLLRRGWQEWQRILGAAWYTAGELASMWIMWRTRWIEALFWTETNVADYMLADQTGLMNITTTEWDFGRLFKGYWLSALENVPEFGWEAWLATLPLGSYKWAWILGKTKKTADTVKKVQKLWQAQSELSTISKINNSIRKWLGITAEWNGSRSWLNRMVDNTLKITEGKNIKFNNLVKIWANIWKWAVQDQLIDWLASYYDSEAYSSASFLLSTWLTWITEFLVPALKYSQIWKRLQNIWRGIDESQWTAWRVMEYLTKDPETMARLEWIFGKWNVTFDVLKWIWSNWWEYEDIMRVAYNLLNPEWKVALNKFSKDLAFQKLNELKSVDWDSAYWQNLLNIINNRNTNVADVFKYMFNLPWQVEIWGFMSKILLKDWTEALQTRLLKSQYDVSLDILSWWFRKRLSEWFTIDDINQLQTRTKYKELMDWWTPKQEYFAEDGGKYYLTSEWAKKFWLSVTNYTDAMRKADLRRATEEETKNFLEEKTAQLMLNKGLTKETINRLASSWGFQKVVDSLSTVVCRI